jgi:hypothetical protein
MEPIDKEVMKIFDTEWRKFNKNVFTQVENLFDEEGVQTFDDEQFDRYVLSYSQNVTYRLISSGITPKIDEVNNKFKYVTLNTDF